MIRIPVISSNVHSIGFDTDSDTLEVQFNDGSVYNYYNVPEYVYDNFMQATSYGKYLHTFIVGVYGYARVS